MSLYPELDDLSLDELIQRFHGHPLDGKKYATVYYEEVAARVPEHGKEGIQFLMDQARNVENDEPRLRAVMLGLTLPRSDYPLDDPWFKRFLLAHLEDRRPAIVTDAIDSLAALGARFAHDGVLALAGHRSPYVRGGVLHYLATLFPEEAKPLLLAGLRDRHFVVRESAVDALDEMAAVDTLDAIRPMRNDPHPHVRAAAEGAVHHLSTGVAE